MIYQTVLKTLFIGDFHVFSNILRRCFATLLLGGSSGILQGTVTAFAQALPEELSKVALVCFSASNVPNEAELPGTVLLVSTKGVRVVSAQLIERGALGTEKYLFAGFPDLSKSTVREAASFIFGNQDNDEGFISIEFKGTLDANFGTQHGELIINKLLKNEQEFQRRTSKLSCYPFL